MNTYIVNQQHQSLFVAQRAYPFDNFVSILPLQLPQPLLCAPGAFQIVTPAPVVPTLMYAPSQYSLGGNQMSGHTGHTAPTVPLQKAHSCQPLFTAPGAIPLGRNAALLSAIEQEQLKTFAMICDISKRNAELQLDRQIIDLQIKAGLGPVDMGTEAVGRQEPNGSNGNSGSIPTCSQKIVELEQLELNFRILNQGSSNENVDAPVKNSPQPTTENGKDDVIFIKKVSKSAISKFKTSRVQLAKRSSISNNRLGYQSRITAIKEVITEEEEIIVLE